MSEEKRNRLNSTIRIASLIILALGLVLLILAAQKKIITGTAYHVLVGVLLFVFWLAMDVVSPIMTKEFEGRTPEQMSAYRTYALMELAGYAGLGFFAISVNGRYGLYGALVFVLVTTNKRRFYNRYLGIEEKEDASDDEDTSDEEEISEEETSEEETDTAGEDPVLEAEEVKLPEEDSRESIEE